MNGCQFGFGSSVLRGKIESGGGLCASSLAETSAGDSALLIEPRLAQNAAISHREGGKGKKKKKGDG